MATSLLHIRFYRYKSPPELFYQEKLVAHRLRLRFDICAATSRALLFTDVLEVGDGEELVELSTAPPEGRPAAAEEAGVAAYEFSEYEERSQAYQENLAQREEDWFPRKAVVEPKGPEGGEYPHAPLPVYGSYPGKDFVTKDGETYEIDRTWIGDIAAGTEVTLENVGGQGGVVFCDRRNDRGMDLFGLGMVLQVVYSGKGSKP